MSNHSYIDYLLDSYLRYQFFSSPNGSAGAQDYSRDGSQAISAVSGPPTAGAWEMRAGDGWANQNGQETSSASHERTTPTAITQGTPNVAPSPVEMGSPLHMQGPASGQSPVASAPSTARRRSPSFIKLRSTGSNLYRCECLYETQRKSDFDRHCEGTKHAGKKHRCSIPNCTKSYTRKSNLKKHQRTHSLKKH
ncbi:hypothetical protein AX14_003636 [Amanita brunnescens Koide BX004]|nr:hypothetical protein AX14_003636 [Amanita brunnescens Koide BX004]